jgi:hypothetical protein
MLRPVLGQYLFPELGVLFRVLQLLRRADAQPDERSSKGQGSGHQAERRDGNFEPL